MPCSIIGSPEWTCIAHPTCTPASSNINVRSRKSSRRCRNTTGSKPSTATDRPARSSTNFARKSKSFSTARRITSKRDVMNQTIRKELLAQLQHLRTETKEISRLYVANLQRDIVQLIEFLNENGDPAVKSRTLSPILLQMKETLDDINLKPEK